MAETSGGALTRIARGAYGPVPAFVAVPSGAGPWPGVVVVHDALGMTEDLRNQARWLADAGYLAAAPDLFHWGRHIRCVVRVMRDLARGTRGPAFADLAAVQGWLAHHPQGTGRVGIMGFCLGGGFALMLAPRHGYSASAVNYGGMSEQAWDRLAHACPIVASYGGNDPTLKGTSARLEGVLASHGIPHDVKEYQGVGHGFMNDHAPGDSPWIFTVLARLSRTRYDERATLDARRRIARFFDTHLKGGARTDDR
ncbi:MAG: dienelactone hydrolase family protein [Vicinamibacterales bacterium]